MRRDRLALPSAIFAEFPCILIRESNEREWQYWISFFLWVWHLNEISDSSNLPCARRSRERWYKPAHHFGFWAIFWTKKSNSIRGKPRAVHLLQLWRRVENAQTCPAAAPTESKHAKNRVWSSALFLKQRLLRWVSQSNLWSPQWRSGPILRKNERRIKKLENLCKVRVVLNSRF